MRILVVEDEKDLNDLICEKLRSEQYAVDTCYDGKTALEYLLIGNYDGVILDIMLPEMNGYTVLKKMHAHNVYTPVLFLSAKTAVEDIVQGLDEGADDYMIKPFDFDVLLARLRVMLRKAIGVHTTSYECGDLIVNISRQAVFRAGEEIELTKKEFAILTYLIRNKGIVVSREQILSGVWNNDGDISSNIVDVYVRLLRKKIDNPFSHPLIKTIRGVGYTISE